MVERVLRFVLAGALLCAAVLKVYGWTVGTIVQPLHALAVFAEAGLACGLALGRGRTIPWLVATVSFLVLAMARGLVLAAQAGGMEGECGCLGPLMPLRVRQQLVLSALLLILAGLTMTMVRSGARRSG